MLAGGPRLAEVGALAGISVPAGGVQHQVFVTEQHPAFADTPMAFDVPSGLYWRPEEGGLLFGMSDPDEPPGENRTIDYDYLALMRSRLAALVPLTAGLGIRRAWAATIDFTPDHLPIIGAAPGYSSVFVASAGGAGMMWGPAVARVAADLALTGASDVVDTTDLGLDRFDESGHSRLAADPIALPFPEKLAFRKNWLPTRKRPAHDRCTARDRHRPARRRGHRGTRGLGAARGGDLARHPDVDPGLTIWSAADDSGASAGIWECTAGPSYWVQDETEVIYVLSGTLTVTPDGGSPTDIGPGDVAVFPRGWTGAWQLHETVRKVYVIF